MTASSLVKGAHFSAYTSVPPSLAYAASTSCSVLATALPFPSYASFLALSIKG